MDCRPSPSFPSPFSNSIPVFFSGSFLPTGPPVQSPPFLFPPPPCPLFPPHSNRRGPLTRRFQTPPLLQVAKIGVPFVRSLCESVFFFSFFVFQHAILPLFEPAKGNHRILPHFPTSCPCDPDTFLRRVSGENWSMKTACPPPGCLLPRQQARSLVRNFRARRIPFFDGLFPVFCLPKL